MSSFLGADTDALREFAGRASTTAGSARELHYNLDLSASILRRSWHGPDADAWQDSFTALAPRIEALGDVLTERARDLRQQAMEQDDASRDPNAPTVMDVARFGYKSWKGYKTVRGLMDHAEDMKRLVHLHGDNREMYEAAWESLKLRNLWDWQSEGFAKAFKRAAAEFLPDAVKGVGLEDLAGKAGKWIDGLPLDLQKGSKLADVLGTASRWGGRVLPFADIAFGIHDVVTADDTYGRVQGGLSVLGGGLMMAGIAFPPLAALGAGLSAVSLGMSLLDDGGELFGADPSKVISGVVAGGAKSIGEGISDAGDAVMDRLGSIF